MKGREILAARDQFGQDLFDLSEATGPAMAKYQRDGVLDRAGLVDKVNVVATKPVDLDLGHVLRQLVQPGLLLAPVEAILPIVGHAFQVEQRRATAPWFHIRYLVWIVGCGDLGLEALDLFIGDVDLVGDNGSHVAFCSVKSCSSSFSFAGYQRKQASGKGSYTDFAGGMFTFSLPKEC